MTKWAKLKEGWGLEEVPSGIARHCVCRICLTKYRASETLYTTESIRRWSNLREYQAMVERLQANTFCRYHAQWYYGDPEGELQHEMALI